MFTNPQSNEVRKWRNEAKTFGWALCFLVSLPLMHELETHQRHRMSAYIFLVTPHRSGECLLRRRIRVRSEHAGSLGASGTEADSLQQWFLDWRFSGRGFGC